VGLIHVFFGGIGRNIKHNVGLMQKHICAGFTAGIFCRDFAGIFCRDIARIFYGEKRGIFVSVASDRRYLDNICVNQHQ